MPPKTGKSYYRIFDVRGMQDRHRTFAGHAEIPVTVRYRSGRCPPVSGLETVIRCFFGDDHVVYMRFGEARRCDTDKFGLGLELPNVFAAGVTHARTESADKLRNNVRDRSFERDASHEAF